MCPDGHLITRAVLDKPPYVRYLAAAEPKGVAMRLGVVLDLDGTLVDSVYHHVLAWDRALSARGHAVPLRRIHAGIGMGSKRLISWLLSTAPDDVNALADEHTQLFLEQRKWLRPTPGALELLADLKRRDVPMVVATSASEEETAALIAALGNPDMTTTHADAVDDAKPAADLLLAASEQIGIEPRQAVLVGDSPWDVAAAARIAMQSISVRTGGFSDAALHARGPTAIVDDPAELIGTL
jgi:HAD superfamily hydrolase (TIGR01509 family)